MPEERSTGKIAELTQEGVLCKVCGGWMEDVEDKDYDGTFVGPGYPRKCRDCWEDEA